MLEKLSNKYSQILSKISDVRKGQLELIEEIRAQTLFQSERFLDEKRLLRCGWKAYSQSDEDGIIHEIFRRIGTDTKHFLEFGVSAEENNTLLLLLSGWSGVWLDGDPKCLTRAKVLRDHYPLQTIEAFITPETVDKLVSALVDKPLDLLSIDVDSTDYWIWKAIKTVQPRVVVLEYNATIPAHLSLTTPPDQPFWNGANHYGASLAALTALSAEKGYALVGCSPNGVNAFYVRNDLLGDHFRAPYTAENHYEPPRYNLRPKGGGHPPGVGAWLPV